MDTQQKDLFNVLTSHSWDNGTGRKMLFLKHRYYVFDDEHKLLDGGVIRYNKMLEKIFIRNEDLRGEVFLSLEDEKNIHLQGAVYSKLSGQINIDNVLTEYKHELKAPLSRVAKVERYLTPTHIYEILLARKEIDQTFLQTYEKSLHLLSTDQARELYIKLSPEYFKNFEGRLLKTITLFFSMTEINNKLYEELFMFLMVMQTAYENNHVKTYDLENFISSVKDRLLEAYEKSPVSISINMINETLLYFHIDSPHLPTVKDCISKLYDKDLNIQKEYAYYLSLMGTKVKEAEEEVLKRLVAFYQEKFFIFKKRLTGKGPKEEKIKKVVTELSTQLALIQTLGNCKSDNKEVHIFLLFLLSNPEGKVKISAKKALLNIKEKALHTYKSFDLQVEIKQLQDEI